MLNRIILAACLASAMSGSAALAAQGAGSVEFNGALAPACAFSNPKHGLLEQAANLKSFNHHYLASIDLMTTGGAAGVSVNPPTSWTSSPPNTPATKFKAPNTYLEGANRNQPRYENQSGPMTFSLPVPGANQVIMTLRADADSVLPPRDYVAEYTLTCVAE